MSQAIVIIEKRRSEMISLDTVTTDAHNVGDKPVSEGDVRIEANSNTNSDSDKVERKETMIDDELFDHSIRIMICYFFSVISTFINVIVFVLRAYIPSIAADIKWIHYHCFIIASDATVNLICLYLQYLQNGKSAYHKCCIWMHISCKKCVLSFYE